MAKILSGKEVAAALEAENTELIKELKGRGIIPRMALVRVGENPDDISYQETLERCAKRIAMECEIHTLPAEIKTKDLSKKLTALSKDLKIHGILLFCPLPKELDEKAAREAIDPKKDIDCLTRTSSAAIFAGDEMGFAPCTARAVIEILKYYSIPVKGSRAVIIGRSQVVGRPLSMLLLKENATVTIAHSQSRNLPAVCRQGDILIAAIGRPAYIGKEYTRPGQTLIDVGINEDPDKPGFICGDINFNEAKTIVEAITPVPEALVR